MVIQIHDNFGYVGDIFNQRELIIETTNSFKKFEKMQKKFIKLRKFFVNENVNGNTIICKN